MKTNEYLTPNQIPVEYMPKSRVVSRFGLIHIVRSVAVDERGVWLMLVDGREFHASDFRPLIEEVHGSRLEVCKKCQSL